MEAFAVLFKEGEELKDMFIVTAENEDHAVSEINKSKNGDVEWFEKFSKYKQLIVSLYDYFIPIPDCETAVPFSLSAWMKKWK